MALLSAGMFFLAAPQIAGAHTCGDVWCSGNDSTTRYNVQGNNPEIYMGEVGVYYRDIAGSAGPCPSDANQSCFNEAAASAALSQYQAGTGMGPEFYYLTGGGDSIYWSQYGSRYCFGWHQGKLAVNDANNYHGGFAYYALIMSLDIEQNNAFGWSNQTQNANRSVYQGFRDYVLGKSSGDPTNCPTPNSGFTYQHMVYSSPSQWSYSFGSSYGNIQDTPEWTSEYCCRSTYPTGFGSGSTAAQWFGSSNYHDMWQFDESPDYDQLLEPVYLPYFGYSIGS